MNIIKKSKKLQKAKKKFSVDGNMGIEPAPPEQQYRLERFLQNTVM